MKVSRFVVRVALAALVAGLFLASCATVADQDAIRAYPLQPLQTLADPDSLKDGGRAKTTALPLPGLSSTVSANEAFPDLFLFAQQNQSPALYAVLSARVPSLLGFAAPDRSNGLDGDLLSRTNQLLLYRPKDTRAIQGLLVGRYAVELSRADFMGRPGWTGRRLEAGDRTAAFVFENAATGMRIAFIDVEHVAIQKDDGAAPDIDARRFTNHVLRAKSFAKGNFEPVVDLLDTQKQVVATPVFESEALQAAGMGAAGAAAGVPAEARNLEALSYLAVLMNEKPLKAVAVQAALASPAAPGAAARLRVEPLYAPGSEGGLTAPAPDRYDLQLTLAGAEASFDPVAWLAAAGITTPAAAVPGNGAVALTGIVLPAAGAEETFARLFDALTGWGGR